MLRAAAAVVFAVLTASGTGCRPASPSHSTVSAPDAVLTQPSTWAVGDQTGRELYQRHCASCHGLDGDGRGAGARSLFPRARNFRTSEFRLVSTVNGVPAPGDVDGVLRDGVPGTSMPSFRELDTAAREALTAEVLRLRREGLRETLVYRLREETGEDDLDEHELRGLLDGPLTPGEAVAVPTLGEATPELIRKGEEIFIAQNCPRCHGRDGNGETALYLADDEGYPARPRNLVWEEFKGGRDPASLFVRIRLGLPGTPMAANPNLSDQQLSALVHFCRSLSREPKWQLTNHQRSQLVLERGFLSPGHPQHPTRP